MRHSSVILGLSVVGSALATMPSPVGTTMMHVMPSSSVMSQPASVRTSAINVMMSSSAAMAYTTAAPKAATTSKAEYAASMAPPSAAAGPTTHTVTVGGTAGLIYNPSQVMAQVKDVVHFVFMSQNHTVTQSSFDKPCNKLFPEAFDSNFMPNPNNTKVPAPTFDYTVTAKEPTWWYCKQRTGNHCGKGMVFAINPTAEKSFDIFKAAAIRINGTVESSTGAAATVSAVSSTVTLIASGGTTAGAAITNSAGANAGAVATQTAPPVPIVTGWNRGGSGVACSCACFCGVGAFPAGDGIGAYGGMGGSLPAPW